MVKKTVILKSGKSEASSDKDSVARPDIKAITAEEEIKADEKAAEEKDAPEPGAKPDARPRCEHGRLFKCQQCEATKGKKTPEELAKRRERLEDVVGQFYKSAFNIAALIADEESLRLKPEEINGLSTTGATTVEEVAPETSLKALAVVCHTVTLAGLVTGKVWDALKNKREEKDKGINQVLDRKGQNGEKHSPADSGVEEKREIVSGPVLLKLPSP